MKGIDQIPESDRDLHCGCHVNAYEHKASAHRDSASHQYAPCCPADANTVRFYQPDSETYEPGLYPWMP